MSARQSQQKRATRKAAATKPRQAPVPQINEEPTQEQVDLMALQAEENEAFNANPDILQAELARLTAQVAHFSRRCVEQGMRIKGLDRRVAELTAECEGLRAQAPDPVPPSADEPDPAKTDEPGAPPLVDEPSASE